MITPLLLLAAITFTPARPTVGDPITVDFPAPVTVQPSKDYEVVAQRGKSVVVRSFEPKTFTLHTSAGDVMIPVHSVLKPTDPLPPFLLPLRIIAGDLAGTAADEFAQALVTEYGPGAAIGWHRDRSVFAEVVGLSLLSDCTFRLRRAHAGASGSGAGATGARSGRFERASLTLARRSAYLLSGPARDQWEHSIPEVELGPRNAPTVSGISAQASMNGWSIRLRPTWSLRVVIPEASSSLAFSIAPPAST